MTTATRRGGIEIGHGNDMAQVLERIEQKASTSEADTWSATPAFLVPSVMVRMPRRRTLNSQVLHIVRHRGTSALRCEDAQKGSSTP